MLRTLWLGCLTLGLTGLLSASEIQGVVVDWKCAKPMVSNGREKTLHQDRNCSLIRNYNRPVYGLITDDKKFYQLEDPGNGKILQLLKGTADKDNLKVIINGDIQGGSIKIVTISEL